MRRRANSFRILGLTIALAISASLGRILHPTVATSRSTTPTPEVSVTGKPAFSPSLASELQPKYQKDIELPKFRHGRPVAGEPATVFFNYPTCCPADPEKTAKWLASPALHRGSWVFYPNPKRLSKPCYHLDLLRSHPVQRAASAAENKLRGIFGTTNYYVLRAHRPGSIFQRDELTGARLDQIELWIAITENRFRPAEVKIVKELQKATGLAAHQLKLTFPPPDGAVGEIVFSLY